MEFYKLEAAGNDFIVTIGDYPTFYNIPTLCNRHLGIGADGYINVDKFFNVTIFNSDGSNAKMCGNGLRCVSKLLYNLTKNESHNLSVGGTIINTIQLDNNTASITFPSPIMIKQDKGYFVSLPNHHYIILVDDINNFEFSENEKNISVKNVCNVHVVQIKDKNTIKIKSYEYGVGLTNSCGSGSMAAFYCLYMLGKVNESVDVISIGGTLNCSYTNNNYIQKGPVRYIYKGEYYGI